MELKITNSNGCNVVINNLYTLYCLFLNILKIELNKGLQSLFQSRDSITRYPQTKIPHNFHFINQNTMIQSFLYIYKSLKPISIFYFFKKVIF